MHKVLVAPAQPLAFVRMVHKELRWYAAAAMHRKADQTML
jgi:hypothetical protein